MMANQIIIFFVTVSCVVLGTGCKAPIQLSNITITEHFRQNLDFNQIEPNQRMEVIENMLITEIKTGIDDDNLFQAFINSSDGSETIDALFNGNVGTEGNITFTVSLLPYNKRPKGFEVIGIGSYDIINNKNDQIYFTSNFHLTECVNCDDINKLIENNSFSLALKFTQVAINQFNYKGKEGKKYKHIPKYDIEVHVNLIKQKKYGKECFSINYGSNDNPYKHSVYFQDKPIGTLTITPPKDISSKIIDLKNIKMLIRKYKNITP